MAATSPAFAAVTDDDHRGILWIAAILSLIFTLLTLSARLYVRKHMLGRDDYAVVAAVVISIAQYGTVFSGMQLGLGTSDPRERHGNVPQMGRVSFAQVTESGDRNAQYVFGDGNTARGYLPYRTASKASIAPTLGISETRLCTNTMLKAH